MSYETLAREKAEALRRAGHARILAVESSCDETAMAVVEDGRVLKSSVIASQIDMHALYGGVVPEIASRMHVDALDPLLDQTLEQGGYTMDDIDAVGVTFGPGLVGALLTGVAWAKAFAYARQLPLIPVNHIEGHVSANYIASPELTPPFVCLVASGGHSHIVRVDDYGEYTILGGTTDDAAGEAFDKCAKIMSLPYPGGPVIDRLAKEGDPKRFKFAKPSVDGFNYSFSGLKTSFLYFLRDRMHEDPRFIDDNKADLCASLQATIIDILLAKLTKAAKQYDIRDIAIAGGVSANSGLRDAIAEEGRKRGWRTFLPEFRFTTDNAAMIAVTGYFKYQRGEFAPMDISPVARISRM